MRGRFSEGQIMEFMREAAAGSPVREPCWNDFVSCAMFRAWTARYGKANVVAIDRLKQLELENARLKKALAHASGHLQRLRAKTSNAACPPARISNIAYRRPDDAVTYR
jgi:putative transposase